MSALAERLAPVQGARVGRECYVRELAEAAADGFSDPIEKGA